MQTVSHEISIPAAEMEKAIAAHFDDSVQQTVLTIALSHTPDRERLALQLNDLIKSNALTYMFPHMITDHDGRTIATLRPAAEDLDRHLVRHVSQSMRLDAILLSPVLDRFFGEYGVTASAFVAILEKSVAFTEMQSDALKAGIDCYIAGEYATAAHVLIPQIERSFRQILEAAGGSILESTKEGGYDLRTLGRILSDPVLVDVFGDNAMFYLQTLLTSKLGWNVRNDVCHGITPWDHLDKNVADRLVHVLMLLSLTTPLESAE
jgi:hypothetical protein